MINFIEIFFKNSVGAKLKGSQVAEVLGIAAGLATGHERLSQGWGNKAILSYYGIKNFMKFLIP